MKVALMKEIYNFVHDAGEPVTYAQIAKHIGVDKKEVNKDLLMRVFGFLNFPYNKIKFAGYKSSKKPVCNAKGRILISNKHLEDADIPFGTRFNIEVTQRGKATTIVLTSEGVDDDYRKKVVPIE